MKKYIVMLLMFLSSCSKDDIAPKGCLTAQSKITGSRSFLLCCTEQEYKDQDFANWDRYTDHRWELCEACK
jgi:hypothetical protein